MERTALEKIINWNNSSPRKPLIVYGARQVGKSYLIKNIFAERYYKDKYIYIDLKEDEVVRDYILFGGSRNSAIVSAKTIIEYLSLKYQRKIDKNTLLIFDEAQECLPIITSLKYFKQDFPEIPVIVSGSMVSIKIKREQANNKRHKKESFFFPVGGNANFVLYPISFEEFLMNYNKMLYDSVKNAYLNKEPLHGSIHELAMEALYNYLLVGGMPETVAQYLNDKDLLKARENTASIFNDYLSDMNLYQASSESIIRSKIIFESIYNQLDKESKNFKSSLVAPGLKSRDIRSPKDWLTLANIVYESKQVKENVTFPLKEDNENSYRLYLFDNGLFTYQSKINMVNFFDGNIQNTLSGILFENYIATELVSNEIPLFYWKGKNSSEFEFLIECNNRIIPVDVKKGTGSLTSLKNYRAINKCDLAIKISKNNYGYDSEHKILTIPLYEAFMLIKDIKNNKL